MSIRNYKACLPPCPDYDIAGTESWLAEMAASGWQLNETGFSLTASHNFLPYGRILWYSRKGLHGKSFHQKGEISLWL